MSITYIGESRAKPDTVERFQAFMASVVVPLVLASEGCESCQLLQSQEYPNRFLVIERWTSINAHKAAAKTIPKEAIAEYMQLVAEPPKGSYFSTLHRE